MTVERESTVERSGRRRHARPKPLSGVRGRVVLTVLVVTACLYSLLGSIGFLYIANSGRDAIRERVHQVLDQLEVRLRGGSPTVSIVTPDGVEAIATGPTTPVFVPSDDIRSTRTITIGSQSYRLVGHASQAPLSDSLHSLYRGLWIGVPLGVVLTAAIAGLATRRALRPVSEITELAATIDARDVSTRVPVPHTDDEIEHLARTVNEMLDRIAVGRRAQRQFTSDAAHELRTPLMALQGELELANGDPSQPDAGLLRRLGELGNRLALRVDDLVLLSTLDEQPPLDRRATDLLAIVQTESATMPSGDNAPTITIDGNVTVAVVDERLVARAVRNLLANACRHATTAVHVAVGAVDGLARITVDDDGPGVDAADREVVLRRFGRLDEARHTDSGGAGLGLAIVASVAHAHGGDVAVTDGPAGGARFVLSLPSP
ncbi:MAG: putative two-component sensor kinase [Ilumatobacteraceae bacterium]|nr:putative two-component sensor kinase [Ilumatobacteraceae bacterium]